MLMPLQLAYAGVTLLAYLGAYAPEVALWHSARGKPASSDAPDKPAVGSGSASQPPRTADPTCPDDCDASSAAHGAAAGAAQKGSGSGSGSGYGPVSGPPVVTDSAGQGAAAGAVRKNLSVRAGGGAGARDAGLGSPNPIDGDQRSRAQPDWHTLRLCASFTLQVTPAACCSRIFGRSS